MIIYPAIDILGGKVVRLLKGDYGKAENYSLTCVEAALNFKAQGASHIHAVDLDGAKSGTACNADKIADVISASGAFVEVGGGIRSEEQIISYLNTGAGRVILGTVAVRDFGFVMKTAEKYAGKIAVGVDALNEKIAVSGWREVTDINSVDFCKKLRDAGIKDVIYTDISRDGTLLGTDLKVYEKLVKIDGLNVTASGGAASLSEIKLLREIGVDAVIIGKALYEGAINLRDALRAAEE